MKARQILEGDLDPAPGQPPRRPQPPGGRPGGPRPGGARNSQSLDKDILLAGLAKQTDPHTAEVVKAVIAGQPIPEGARPHFGAEALERRDLLSPEALALAETYVR